VNRREEPPVPTPAMGTTPVGATAANADTGRPVGSGRHQGHVTEHNQASLPDRGQVIAQAVRVCAEWSLRFIIIIIALAILLWLLGQVWVGVLPILLALIVSTVLWPVVNVLARRGVPVGLAAAVTLVGSLTLVVGILASIAPSIVNQSREIGTAAAEGLDEVVGWLSGPPFNIDNDQLDEGLDTATSWLTERSGDIASTVFAGVGVLGSGLITLGLVLVLTFFFIKDGPRFLPWLRAVSGRRAGRHLTELLTRMWRTLGGFIRAQAMVSAFDAVFIGLGLLLLGVPLAVALAVLTFFAGFIPIVGAVTAGALAVLVALVSNGWQIALAVLGLVIAVQQIESNLLQPVLQGRTMQLHAGIVLLSVAAGGTLFGIVGAFLAVPVAATLAVLLRYVDEQFDLRTGDISAAEHTYATPEGALAARRQQAIGRWTRLTAHRRAERTTDEGPSSEGEDADRSSGHASAPPGTGGSDPGRADGSAAGGERSSVGRASADAHQDEPDTDEAPRTR
jgi:putative heme transporter